MVEAVLLGLPLRQLHRLKMDIAFWSLNLWSVFDGLHMRARTYSIRCRRPALADIRSDDDDRIGLSVSDMSIKGVVFGGVRMNVCGNDCVARH